MNNITLTRNEFLDIIEKLDRILSLNNDLTCDYYIQNLIDELLRRLDK